MAISYYFWRTSRSGFAKREGKDGLLMHAPISAVFSLFFLPFYFFLFVLLPLFSYYSLTIDCFPFGLFFSWVPLSRWLSPSKCLPQVLPPLGASSFYSKPIQWDFSILPLVLHQLFLAFCGHSFNTAHQPIGCPATISAQNTFAAPLLISWQNSFLFVLAVYLYLLVQMDKD